WVRFGLAVSMVVGVGAAAAAPARAGEPGVDAPLPAPKTETKAAGHQRFMKVCKADIAKLCPDGDGDGAVASCLAGKKGDLAAPCLRALRHAKRVSRFRQTCGEDVGRLCAGIKPGGGRVVSCLKAAGETVSAGCRDRVAKVGARAGRAAAGA